VPPERTRSPTGAGDQRTSHRQIPGDPDRVYRGTVWCYGPGRVPAAVLLGAFRWLRGLDLRLQRRACPGDHLPAKVPVPSWGRALSGRGWRGGLDADQREMLDRSRAATIVNTITIEHARSDRSGKVSYGPDRELVRPRPSCRGLSAPHRPFRHKRLHA
jgi:hypothetical protein